MLFEEILNHFQVVRRNGNKAQCICPAHNDNKASLTISRSKDGKTLVYCHAGCKTQDVLSAVGLTMADLYEKPLQSDKPTWQKYVESTKGRPIVAQYDYRNINGEYVYTKLRLTDKVMCFGILQDEKFNFKLGKSRKELKGMYANPKDITEGKRVFYVEGEKDVNTMLSRGYTAITAGGAQDWQSCFAELFKDTELIILADNDDAGFNLAKQVAKDCKPYAKSIQTLVPVPDVPKADISDYFKNHTNEDFENLLRTAPPVPVPVNLDRFHNMNKQGEPTSVIDNAIYEDIVKCQPLFMLEGTPYLYRNGCYAPDSTGARLKTLIKERIYPALIKSSTINRIYELFYCDIRLQKTLQTINKYPAYWINFQNGFYDPKTGAMIPHDAEYLAVNQIPHRYEPSAQLKGDSIDTWLQYIVPDADDREMLLQYIGLCMTRDTSQQKFMIVAGAGGTGKSTLMNVINHVVGDSNTSYVSLTDLTKRFASCDLVGKLMNTCADLKISAVEDASSLKQLTGEDFIRTEQKNKPAFSFKSYARLFFNVNDPPIIKGERSEAVYRRMLMLTMNRIPAKKDPHFLKSLLSQEDYFIHLCVDALQRMYKAGCITESKNSMAAVNQLRTDSDSVEAWLQESAERLEGAREDRAKCYAHYDIYCTANGYTALSNTRFYKALRTKNYQFISSNGIRYISDFFVKDLHCEAKNLHSPAL